MDLANRAAALDRLRDKLAATKRRHTPLEAPVALTNAYVDLELAYGYARLGKPDRAQALVASARSALGSEASDPVHAVLLAEFVARIDQAIAGRPDTAPLPADVEAQFVGLDRVARYKVSRLREVSNVLAPAEMIDAIGEWIDKQDPRGTELAGTRGLTGDALARELAKIVEAAETLPESARAGRLSATCDALLGLPPPLAAPILRRAIALAATLPPEPRATVSSHVVFVAARLGDAATAMAQVPALAELGNSDERSAVERIVRALVSLGEARALGELLAKLEPRLDPKNLAAALVVAGGWFAAGDATRAQRVIDGAVKALAEPQVLPVRLEITRALAFAYSNAALDVAEPGLAVAVDQFAEITDSYGTNSHYCRSVVQDVESLVQGLVPLDAVF